MDNGALNGYLDKAEELRDIMNGINELQLKIASVRARKKEETE